MPESYFIIAGSEDGGCHMERVSKEECLQRISGDYYGSRRKILNRLPEDICNFTDLVIIKGEIIVPKPKTVVTEYEIP